MIISTITIQDIINKVDELSAYEGRDAYDVSGESDFERVHITDQDSDWLRDFLREGLQHLVMRWSPLADDGEIGSTEVTLLSSQVSDSTRTGYITRICFEALTSYIMQRWCMEYRQSKADLYANLVEESCRAGLVELHRISAPTKHRRRVPKDIPTIEVVYNEETD